MSVFSLYKTLFESKESNIHGLLVMRNGKIIAEGYAAPYQGQFRHVSNSLCKSVVSMAIGIACDEHLLELDERVIDIFPNARKYTHSSWLSILTIRHLLTMTSGLRFNEFLTEFEEDWLRAIFECGIAYRPGSQFQYNSANTYLLVCILKKRTRQRLIPYLQERLFAPLGIFTGW